MKRKISLFLVLVILSTALVPVLGKSSKPPLEGTFYQKNDKGVFVLRVKVQGTKAEMKRVYQLKGQPVQSLTLEGVYENGGAEFKVPEKDYSIFILPKGPKGLAYSESSGTEGVYRESAVFTKVSEEGDLGISPKDLLTKGIGGEESSPSSEKQPSGDQSAPKVPEKRPETKKTDHEIIVPVENEVPENGKKPKTSIERAKDPLKVPLTGGTDRDTTVVYNGTAGVAVTFKAKKVSGYRLYRSETPGEPGSPCHEKLITGGSFVDTDVKGNRTYSYTLFPVVVENSKERLGEPAATWTVTTLKDVEEGYAPGMKRHFILLKIDDAEMIVDGEKREVDPGRGTAPLVYRNRTMVPIRAIVEAMGGTPSWDPKERKVTLKTKDDAVEMWIGKDRLFVNGVERGMDVAPIIRNSRTYVPLRFAAENLNSKVNWLEGTREVVIAWSE